MLRRSFLLCFVLLFSIGSPAWSNAADDTVWKVGVAKVNITPEQLMWMSGYSARDKPAEGKEHDLWAKALVLEDAKGKRGVLVTMDLVGIPRDLSQAVCAELKKKYDLPREAVLLNVSHTHCGPVVGSNLNAMYFLDEKQQKLVDDYAKSLQTKLVSVVGAAIKDLAPAKLEWANGQAGFAVNRRNNKEADVPKLRELGQLKGPVDHELPVLAAYDAKEKLKAVVVGYACHATTLSYLKWCGDWPGFAQIELEKAHPGAMAFVWAGCGADQNPIPRRTVEQAEGYGKQIADGVAALFKKPMKPLPSRLAMSYAEIDLPFADLPTREQLVKDSTGDNKYVAMRAKLLLQQLDRDKSLRGTYSYPVQVWHLGGELTFVALGGEVVVDYSLRLKKELGEGKTWVAGYSNDVMAYIPSLRVLKEGGYEGATSMIYYGQPTIWNPKIEELIVEAVHQQVKKVRGGEK